MNFIVRLLLLLVIILIIEFYFFRKAKAVIKSLFVNLTSQKLNLYTFIIITFINLYPLTGLGFLIYMEITGIRPAFPPSNILFDVFIQFPFWISVIIIIQCVLLFILIDIINIIFKLIIKSKKEFFKKAANKIRFVILSFFLIYAPIRITYDYYAVTIRPVEFKKANLNPSLEGFNIVLIADVQADRYTNSPRLKNYIDKINSVNPDLVLIAGDIITSTPDYINLGAEYLGKIKSKYGVYSCVGDHDNWAYRSDTQRSIKEITNALSNVNIIMLDNEKLILEIDSSKIGIAFITNTYVERVNQNTLDSLTKITNDYDLKVFLTHQPRPELINQAYKQSYDLFLAGHTHGGQLTFFFPFINLSPTLFETKYVRGDFWFGKMLAVVNRGLGMSLVPLRYNSTPEITIIQLSSE